MTITYPLVEKFISINGEGPKAGMMAAFLRMKGCNLSCNYCDTAWANEPGCPGGASWYRRDPPVAERKRHGQCDADRRRTSPCARDWRTHRGAGQGRILHGDRDERQRTARSVLQSFFPVRLLRWIINVRTATWRILWILIIFLSLPDRTP